MDQKFEIEQFFFDKPALVRLAELASFYENPCCLCTPAVGQELTDRGRNVRVLDIDERFAYLPGYRRFDLYEPEDFGEKYDLIICDAPLFTIPMSQLFDVIKMLSQNDYTQQMIVTYKTEFAPAILEAFTPFGLESTGYYPPYLIDMSQRIVEFFGNLGPERHAWLSRE